jgi:hypothetical protein
MITITLLSNQEMFKAPYGLFPGRSMIAMAYGNINRAVRLVLACLLLAGIWFAPGTVAAQVTTATLTGTVADTDGAIIPHAKVTVVNNGNKSTRSADANSSGVFTFPGLDSGDFQLEISAPGFEKYVIPSIHLDPLDTRNITTIRMHPGGLNETVTVTTTGLNHVEDDGSRSAVITAEDLKKLSLEGREVTELLKILPGSAINTGIGNNTADSNTAYDPGQVNFSGAAGSYSMSGSPVNGVAIRSDGANLTDPGSGAGALQTINAEATAEVKVQTSNFGADNANGPLVISAVSKSGGVDYHGSLYSYGRTSQLNSTDSIARLLNTVKPPDRYIYPGASIGGPIKIPGTNLNRNKHLTFFASGEDYIQRNVYAYNSVSNAVTHALVPTAAMRQGDFSATQIANYLPSYMRQYVCDPTLQVVCPNLNNVTFSNTADLLASTYSNLNQIPVSATDGTPIICKGNPGDCMAGHMDPGAVAMFDLMPLPNTPDGTTTDLGYNYTHTDLVDSDIYELHGRLDYSMGKSKFYLVYTNENGQTDVPQAEGGFNSGGNGGINTPGGSLRTTLTDSASFNWNIAFSATLDNEAFVSGLYSDQIDSPGKPSLLFDSANGYPYTGAYNNDDKEYPDLATSGTEGVPLGYFPDYSFGDLFNRTFNPSFGDNLSKQAGKHTIKIGMNVERPIMNGTLANNGSTPSNGATSIYYVGAQFLLPSPGGNLASSPFTQYYSTCYQASDTSCGLSNYYGNNLANYLGGDLGNNGWTQTNGIPHIKMHAWTTSMYATDDLKILRNLTLTFGLRVEHISRWTDDHGFGSAVFDPSLYFSEKDVLNNPQVPLPGFRWHSIDSSIPVGGFETRAFYYEPRVGFNWDVYGTGKTSLSGGYGQYRFRDGQQDSINSVEASNGLRTITVMNEGPYSGSNPLNQGEINQGGLRASYIQSLNLSPSPGIETSTFYAENGNNYPSAGGIFYAVDPKDSEVPMTSNYSLTVTQQMPKDVTFSVGYVGNRSQYLLDDNGNGPTISNINALPVGSLFKPDPNPESALFGLVFTPSNADNTAQNDYRPYNRYTDIQVESHILTAHYDALQLTAEHSKGGVYIKANYTWSKNFGQRGGYSNGNAGDSFNLANDYGPLAYDRTHIFNFSFNFDFGSKYHGSRILRPVLNGWQLSGITNLQSGPDLLATNYTTNFNFNGTLQSIALAQTFYLGNITFLGTPDVNLQPLLTCNPATHLAPRQYVNPNCFSTPAQGGQNGPFRIPYLHGPAYFQSDLTVVKDINFKDHQVLEFRLAAFNFLNYKLKTFSNVDPNALTLIYPLTNDGSFGTSLYNSGRRVMEIAVKYTF